jgi:cysteine desulfuration protein SufE
MIRNILASDTAMSEPLSDLIADFDFLDDWDDKYRYVIELGRELDPIDDEQRNDQTKVLGCTSQVWLISRRSDGLPLRLQFNGDSDAHIVRGLIAILFKLYSNKTPEEILSVDAKSILGKLGLDTHLTPQRSNGLFAMVKRIQSDARRALEEPLAK